MSDDVKRLDIREFKESGLLQEVNRQFFHPLGLALAIATENGEPVRLAYIIDARDDPEGYVFDDLDAEAVKRGEAVIAEQERRLFIRRERLGYGIQPLPGAKSGSGGGHPCEIKTGFVI